MSDDPIDPGGRTNLGITQRTLDAWRADHPDAPTRVDDLTIDTVGPIYRDRYWLKAGCDQLPEPLALVVFDTAVNLGVTRAKALLAAYNPDWQGYLWARADEYRQIVVNRPASIKFLPGWLRRLVLLYREAIPHA